MRLMAAHTTGAVVVTGASTGIGRATALYLDKAGYQVCRRRPQAERRRRAYEGGLREAHPAHSRRHRGPLIEAAEQRSAARSARPAWRAWSATPGSAGGPTEYIPLDDYRQSFEVNYFGQIAVTQAFLPLLRLARGTIVNIASIGGRIASLFHVAVQRQQVRPRGLLAFASARARPWGSRWSRSSPAASPP